MDLAPEHQRARAIGVYYAIRNLVVVPGGIAGGLLWQQAPTLPLDVACAIGLAGTAVFAITSLRGQAVEESPERSAPASR